MELVDININAINSTKCSIKLFTGNKKIVTKEFLKSMNVQDVA